MQALVRALQIWKTWTLASDGGFVYEGEVKMVPARTGPEDRPVRIWSEMLAARAAVQSSRRVVLLAPGTGDDALACWPAKFLAALREAGFDVLRFDNRGFGCSSWPDFQRDPFGIPDLAGDVEQVLAAWGLAASPDSAGPDVHLIGHSMGSATVQTVLIRQFDERERRRRGGENSSTSIPLFCIRSCVSIGGYVGTEACGAVPACMLSPEIRAFKECMSRGWIWEKNSALARWQVSNFGKSYQYDAADFERRKDVCIRRGGLNVNCPHGLIHERAELQPARRAALRRAVSGWDHAFSHYSTGSLRTLVVHGTHDVVVPYRQGQELHEVFRSACAQERLLVASGKSLNHIFVGLESAGHKYHPPEWDQICSHVVAFLSAPAPS